MGKSIDSENILTTTVVAVQRKETVYVSQVNMELQPQGGVSKTLV